MLSKRHEKIIYENDRGERVEIAYSFPYLLQGFIGADGTDANITNSKGVGQDGYCKCLIQKCKGGCSMNTGT